MYFCMDFDVLFMHDIYYMSIIIVNIRTNPSNYNTHVVMYHLQMKHKKMKRKIKSENIHRVHQYVVLQTTQHEVKSVILHS
jgi:hypothetical protein